MAVTYPQAPGARDVNEEEPTMKVIRLAYDQKIAAYRLKLKDLSSRQKVLIKRVEKGRSMDVKLFMRDAEKIGIDKMNHETIIEMLENQYQEWFGQKSEATVAHEEGRLSESYLDAEIL